MWLNHYASSQKNSQKRKLRNLFVVKPSKSFLSYAYSEKVLDLLTQTKEPEKMQMIFLATKPRLTARPLLHRQFDAQSPLRDGSEPLSWNKRYTKYEKLQKAQMQHGKLIYKTVRRPDKFRWLPNTPSLPLCNPWYHITVTLDIIYYCQDCSLIAMLQISHDCPASQHNSLASFLKPSFHFTA